MLNIFRKHVNLDKDSRIRLYKFGGVANGVIGEPIDMTIESLPEKSYKEILNTINSLKHAKRLEYSDVVGDYGYIIEIGNNNCDAKSLKKIFNGGAWSRTPILIFSLQGLLEQYAKDADFELKP